MGAGIIYIGQTLLASVGGKNPKQGTVMVISKQIEKTKFQVTVLAMDGQEYSSLTSDQLSYIHTKKKDRLSMYYGVACTHKLACGSIPKATLKNDRKKLIDHLKETFELLKKGQLVSDGFTSEVKVDEDSKVVTG